MIYQHVLPFRLCSRPGRVFSLICERLTGLGLTYGKLGNKCQASFCQLVTLTNEGTKSMTPIPKLGVEVTSGGN